MHRFVLIGLLILLAACGSAHDVLDHERMHEELERENAIGAATTMLSDTSGVDLVELGARLTTSLFLEPTQLDTASIQVTTDAFARMNHPTGAVVEVRDVARPNRPVVLIVSFEVVDGRLQFLSAKGEVMSKFSVAADATAEAARYAEVLATLGGVRVASSPENTSKSIDVQFSGAACGLAPEDTRTARFDKLTGALHIYGRPLPPTVIRWRAN